MTKLLIITSCPEGSNGAGAIFLKNNFSKYDYDWINFNDYINQDLLFFQKFFFKNLQYYKNKLKDFKKFFFNNIDINNYDRVIITLSNISLIIFSSEFSSKDKLRLIVWDDFRYIASNHKLNKEGFKDLSDIFYKAINSVKCISVMGYNMAREYEKEANEFVILRNPVFLKDLNRYKGEPINIVFCGSLYAKKEWNSFIRALIDVDFTINGRNVLIHFIGNYPKISVISKKYIIYHGFKSGIELNDLMKRMHIAYLPYWINIKYELVSRTSFPTKLSLYLENGLIIFNHAPSYSESSKLIANYKLGVNVNTYSKSDIINNLSTLVNELENLNYKLNIKKCVATELSSNVMMNNVRELLA